MKQDDIEREPWWDDGPFTFTIPGLILRIVLGLAISVLLFWIGVVGWNELMK